LAMTIITHKNKKNYGKYIIYSVMLVKKIQ
jgi:uncharacterized membrane protein YsdA (DUF1294 family)